MLKILLKKQLTEIFRGYFYDAKKNKARSRAATAAYLVFFVVLMVGVLGGMFALLSAALCSALASAGMDWLYFALMGLLAILLGTFGSVFNTYSGLYLAKDNDQLLSLPIPVSAIMAARLLSVYFVFRGSFCAGTDRLLGHGAAFRLRCGRRRSDDGAALPCGADAVLHAGVGGGPHQPEAEA